MRLLIFWFVFYSSFSFAQKNYTQVIKADSFELKKRKINQEIAKQDMLKRLKKESPLKLDSLLKKFDYKKATSNKGWYYHKAKKDTNRSWIECPVNANGYIYIKARYTGDVQFNIFSINLKFGNKGAQFYGKPLATNSNYIFRKKKGNKYDEVLHSFSCQSNTDLELRSMYIIEAIANAKDEKLVIQFMGEQDNFEFILSKENIAAIRESWQLSQFICFNKNNYSICNSSYPSYPVTRYTAFLFPKDALTREDMKSLEYH